VDIHSGVGAYGLRLTGIEGVESLLVPARPDWPALELARRVGRANARYETLGSDRASVLLAGGGEIVIERSPGRAIYTLPRPLRDDELVHPYLAPAAAVVARWLGRESFHGGAFGTEAGVWVIAGEKGIGKSSTLAWLYLQGVSIVSDDVVVVDDERVFAGPRSIDLREDTARELGVGEHIGAAGERERWRVRLGPVSPELPLRGWIFPTWTSGTTELVPVAAPECLVRLAQNRVMGVVTERPEFLLKLAALPAWELRRPPGWDGFTSALERLFELVRN
jgi:hypothetical protein